MNDADLAWLDELCPLSSLDAKTRVAEMLAMTRNVPGLRKPDWLSSPNTTGRIAACKTLVLSHEPSLRNDSQLDVKIADYIHFGWIVSERDRVGYYYRRLYRDEHWVVWEPGQADAPFVSTTHRITHNLIPAVVLDVLADIASLPQPEID